MCHGRSRGPFTKDSTATDAIGFFYTANWNIVRTCIFSWKLTEPQMGADGEIRRPKLRKSVIYG